MHEVMGVPDNIPQELLEKAECIIVLPSVLKAAFVVGGSYGRGAMVCRTGEHFNGPWGSPAMYALEGASVGFQHRFCLGSMRTTRRSNRLLYMETFPELGNEGPSKAPINSD
jgi:lipid-binding SYLF domain-containing protein